MPVEGYNSGLVYGPRFGSPPSAPSSRRRSAPGPAPRTWPEDCTPGPVFPDTRLTADADLIADGMLIDFKSTRHPHTLRKADAWQLLGYLLLDTADHHQIDTVGLHLTRSDTLVSWPVEEYLDLLGACRRDLPAFRATLNELLEECVADAEPHTHEDVDRIERLLRRLAPEIPPGHCEVCAQPRPTAARRNYCSCWCGVRAPTLRKHGLLSSTPDVASSAG
ncbi:PD-(D/E)XK nuclease family protein [Streptomyces lydicus]|uniref:PD-(D/E)XK nuclease family protein n=1 Tax=Streptomyces lydicus TaxID=47763 RepID=UPI001011312C|nr:PD-(D/E)XK nuclease family protein [Streptomyces lydicus]MCZ1012644.1 PD-(D/E)XK nuclease family protein [Streptomyces lydicus]